MYTCDYGVMVGWFPWLTEIILISMQRVILPYTIVRTPTTPSLWTPATTLAVAIRVTHLL